ATSGWRSDRGSRWRASSPPSGPARTRWCDDSGRNLAMGSIDHLRQRLADEGYVAPIDVLDAAELEHFRSRFEELEAREGRDACVSGIQGWHFNTRFIWELATHPRLLDAMRGLIGDDLLL